MIRAAPAPKPPVVADLLRETVFTFAPAALIEALLDRMEGTR